jgi:hypothetical protein
MIATIAAPSGRRGRPALWVGAFLLAVFLVVLTIDRGRGHINNGDSNSLVAGARTALHCVDAGTWTNCAKIAPFASEVGPYPLLQYLPAALVIGLGGSDRAALDALSWLSLVAFAASLVLGAATLRHRPVVAATVVVALVGSSLAYRATSAFGEMLAAALVLAAVVAARSAPPLLLFGLVAVAGLGKETLPLFVAALCLVAAPTAAAPGGRWLPDRGRIVAIVGGAILALTASALFNIFRFGTPRNAQYLLHDFRTPGVGRKLEFLGGVWLSPTSGIAAFWPVSAALIGAVAARTVVRAVRRRPARQWAGDAVIVVTVVAFTAGLAVWYSPFGWITYGPRLAVPLLPAVVYLAADRLGDRLERMAAFGRAVPLAVALACAGLANYGSTWSFEPAVYQLIAADATCPRMTELNVFEDPDQYFRCASHFMWRLRPADLDDALLRSRGRADIARAAALVGSMCLVVGAARLSADRRQMGQPRQVD